MMPTSRSLPSMIGTPEMWKRCMRTVASRTVSSGRSVIGLRIMPLSDRFTRSTSAAWRSIDMFLCSTARPPARAIAIAISDSVTVSIAAATRGTRSSMPRLNRDATLTSRGWVSECRGMRRTSSKVSATSSRTRSAPFRVDSVTSKREGPPSLLGDAGLDWGRFVVAMAKGNGVPPIPGG